MIKSGTLPAKTRTSMKGSVARNSHRVKAAPMTTATANNHRRATCRFIRNNNSEVSVAPKSTSPMMSNREPDSRAMGSVRGSTSPPRTRQPSASGMLIAKVARQPPTEISSPPSVGPMTAIV